MIKKYTIRTYAAFIAVGVSLMLQSKAYSYTANQVSFESLANGYFRVNLYYTVPALREFREAAIEFRDRKQAETFYFDVVKGADFYVNSSGQVEFNNNQQSPSPW